MLFFSIGFGRCRISATHFPTPLRPWSYVCIAFFYSLSFRSWQPPTRPIPAPPAPPRPAPPRRLGLAERVLAGRLAGRVQLCEERRAEPTRSRRAGERRLLAPSSVCCLGGASVVFLPLRTRSGHSFSFVFLFGQSWQSYRGCFGDGWSVQVDGGEGAWRALLE